MNSSGIMHGYDPRAASSAALNRVIMAPHYMPVNAYSGDVSTGILATSQRMMQHPYSFGGYTTAAATTMVPAFAGNLVAPQRPLPPLLQTAHELGRGANAYEHAQNRQYVEDLGHSSTVKSEDHWKVSAQSPGYVPATSKVVSQVPNSPGSEATFKTEVDTLVKTIQVKSTAQEPSSKDERHVEGASGSKDKKRYICTIDNCNKRFLQKTHLDIHERSHTGLKPYACKFPGCDSLFSQLGNLRTHERRHTGERPYKCSLCDKRFAQRGNVRAHMAVHERSKRFECKLNDCGKLFTQLGNLKSHMNKFHIDTLRDLNAKFDSYRDGDLVPAEDKELWLYFAETYKNSNKGIKGRGRDRKVGPTTLSAHAGMRTVSMTVGEGYSVNGAGRSSIMGPRAMGKIDHPHYEMYDADDASQTSGQSTIGTCYDDAPGEPYEETGRPGELAFGDRLY